MLSRSVITFVKWSAFDEESAVLAKEITRVLKEKVGSVG